LNQFGAPAHLGAKKFPAPKLVTVTKWILPIRSPIKMKAQPSALPGDVPACASGFSSGACGRKSILTRVPVKLFPWNSTSILKLEMNYFLFF
jgi:hypothetical protein